MIKWLAFFFALIALCSSADESKVRSQFDQMETRLHAIENRKCTLMAVDTPSGIKSICVDQ